MAILKRFHLLFRTILALLLVLAAAPTARAGMPAPFVLTERAAARFDTLSFFLLVFVLSALAIRFLWNALARDISVLPRLSYLGALAFTFLWGLLFILVLTMISGARELLTPGAWEPNGATYKLKKDANPNADPSESNEEQRRRQVEQLRRLLWEYAAQHQGRFPADSAASGFPSLAWQTPDVTRIPYIYVSGLKADEGNRPLVYEPGIYGNQRLVLFTNGAIRTLPVAEIQDALKAIP
jgi:hypothetical protein